MTSLAPASRRLVIVDRVMPRSLALDVVLVTAGAALTTLLAQVRIEMWPVPVTGQTLAVLLVGSALGTVRGSLALGVYVVVGALGLPVYSDYSGGLAVLGGPTGGYIFGFVIAAALVGWLSERAWERHVVKALITFGAGLAVVYACGLPWLAAVLGELGLPNDLATVLNAGLTPFLIGEAIKVAIAAGLLPLAWRAVERLRGRGGAPAA